MDSQSVALARDIARNLDREVLVAVETLSRSGEDEERAVPLSPGKSLSLSDAMTIGGFLIACAQLALQLWQLKMERLPLIEQLYANVIEKPANQDLKNLTEEERLRIISLVVDKLAPEKEGISTKDFLAPTILQPFKEMTVWIVRQEFSWKPLEASAASLPAVRVPLGFVCDLTSIPIGLKWAIHPTGTHAHAAILHDWLYWEQNEPREIADRVFDAALGELGVSSTLRRTIWTSLRIAGGWAWDANTKEKRDGGKRVLKVFPSSPAISWEEWKVKDGVFA